MASILKERGVKPEVYEVRVQRELHRRTVLAMACIVATIATLLMLESLDSLVEHGGLSGPETLRFARVM